MIFWKVLSCQPSHLVDAAIQTGVPADALMPRCLLHCSLFVSPGHVPGQSAVVAWGQVVNWIFKSIIIKNWCQICKTIENLSWFFLGCSTKISKFRNFYCSIDWGQKRYMMSACLSFQRLNSCRNVLHIYFCQFSFSYSRYSFFDKICQSKTMENILVCMFLDKSLHFLKNICTYILFLYGLDKMVLRNT